MGATPLVALGNAGVLGDLPEQDADVTDVRDGIVLLGVHLGDLLRAGQVGVGVGERRAGRAVAHREVREDLAEVGPAVGHAVAVDGTFRESARDELGDHRVGRIERRGRSRGCADTGAGDRECRTEERGERARGTQGVLLAAVGVIPVGTIDRWRATSDPSVV